MAGQRAGGLRYSLGAIALLVLSLVVPTQACSAAAAGPFMPEGVAAGAPDGFAAMCAHDAQSCHVPALPLDQQPDAAKAQALLNRVNAEVNKAVRFREDRAELWQRPVAQPGRKLEGDCEDYSLEKRARLIAEGYPADSLFFAVAYVPRAGLHTVLVARLPEGDHVLDNRTPWVTPWDQTGYTWVLRQSASASSGWVNLVLARQEQLAAL